MRFLVTEPPERVVVACVLSHEEKFLLLRRSRLVGSDRGMWHCVTGHCPDGTDPWEQALVEIREETGLMRNQLQLHRRAAPLLLASRQGTWTVHAFHFESTSRRVTLNWEHDNALWTDRSDEAALPMVPWYDRVRSVLMTAGAELDYSE